MAAAFKFSLYPDTNHLACRTKASHPAAECKHIGIIMSTRHAGRKDICTERSPDPLDLVGRNGNAKPSAAENDSAISWYNLDLDGRSLPKLTTYHSFSGGWFLKLPDRWQNQFCITRGAEADGVHGYAFSQWEDGRRTELIFTIYAFSGENRNESASADGRFILAEKGDITYAAKLGTGKWAEELSADRLRDMFHFIHIDWNSGET